MAQNYRLLVIVMADFEFDAFLCASVFDEDAMEELAELLKENGLNTFSLGEDTESSVASGQEIENILGKSRTLIILFSEWLQPEDWRRFELYTFRFRDPSDDERRLLLVNLDEGKLPGTLRDASYFDVPSSDRVSGFRRVLDALLPRRPVENKPTNKAKLRFPERRVHLKHPVWVDCYVMSASGTALITGAVDRKIRIWDVETGECIKILLGHSGAIYSMALNAAGNMLASVSSSGEVFVWDVAEGNLICELEPNSGPVLCVEWSHIDDFLATGSADGTIRIWGRGSYEPVTILKGHASAINGICWSDDDSFIFSGSDDTTVRSWNIQNQSCVRILEGHTSRVRNVAVQKSPALWFLAEMTIR